MNKILKWFMPPIVLFICSKEGFDKTFSFVYLKLYSLIRGKSTHQLMYDELKKTLAENPEIDQLFSEEQFKKHYVYCMVRNSVEHPDLYISQIRYFRMYQYFKKNYPDLFEANTKILDVGDTSGLLLKGMGKTGTSLNINQECVDQIIETGVHAVLGDAEKLDIPDNNYDYAFSFQCVEHLLNPLAAINELGRVAKKKVFISIPYQRQTRMYDVDFWVNLRKSSWKQDDVKEVDCHVFEFSSPDLKKLLSYTSVDFEKSFPIHYFDNNTFLRRRLNGYFGSYFNFFVLNPKNEEQTSEEQFTMEQLQEKVT